MASTNVSAGNKTTRFQEKVRREYVRGGRFGPHIGPDQNKIIQTNRDLKKTSIALVGKLSGGGVTGGQQLSGNEEQLSNHAHTAQPTYWRNGVLIDQEERELSEFDLFTEARPALMNWTMEKKRDQIIQAFNGLEAGGTYFNYGGSEGAFGSSAASAANMDTWQGNNEDRILYGAAKSNLSSGDHTASLGNIDTTDDKLDADMVTLAKRMAEQASPLIRPIMVREDEPWYVFWVDPYGFRDLKEDTTIAQANREARPREVMENPIFTGGDLVYDGVIIKKIPEIATFIDGDSSGSPWDGVWGANADGDSLADSGDSSSRVGVGFLTGGQAVAFGIGRMASFKRRKEDDYEHLAGVGVSMKHDIKGIFYNTKQHGKFTVFYSAAVDS